MSDSLLSWLLIAWIKTNTIPFPIVSTQLIWSLKVGGKSIFLSVSLVRPKMFGQILLTSELDNLYDLSFY